MRRISNFHDPLEAAALIPNALVSSLDGLVFGNKRRNFSSICIFIYGAGLAFSGAFAARYPTETLAMMADAWDVQLDAANPAAAFSRHVLAIGGIHLSAWGIGCMCLAPSSAKTNCGGAPDSLVDLRTGSVERRAAHEEARRVPQPHSSHPRRRVLVSA